MPGRNFNENSYRYNFNGKESDPETGTQDYGLRIYNPSLGRFLSVDPLTDEYPWYTPYQFAGNKPIQFIDLDGAEEYNPQEPGTTTGTGTKTTQKDNTAIGYTGKYLLDIAGRTGGAGKPAGIADALTLKLSFGLQLGGELNLAGKKGVTAHVNAGSKDVVGWDQGNFVHIFQKNTPTYSGASIGMAGFNISAQSKSTKTTIAANGILPRYDFKTTEKTGEISYGLIGVNTSQTIKQTIYPSATFTVKSPFTKSTSVLLPTDNALKNIGISAKILVGVEASINIPKLFEGIENDFLKKSTR